MRTPTGGHVLVLGPLPPPVHGAAVVTAKMVDWMRLRGATVEVVDASADSHGIVSVTGRVQALRYLLTRLWLHLVCCARLLRRPDVLYVGGAGGRGLYFQLMPVLVARLLRVPVAFHHHSSAYLTSHSRPMAILCRLTRGRSVQIALSHRMAEQLTERYAGRRRLPVVPLSNAIFVPEPADAGRSGRVGSRRLTGAPVRLGHVSNLSVEKGVPELMDTASALAEAGLDFELHVVGEARDDRTRALVEQLRARPGVTVHGPLYGTALQNFYGELDLMLFPSRYVNEAAPLVVLEAASRGVPSLAYQVGSLGELVFSEQLFAPVGEFAGAAADLVRRWDDVGEELSRLTADGYRRSREAAEAERERLWSGFLGPAQQGAL